MPTNWLINHYRTTPVHIYTCTCAYVHVNIAYICASGYDATIAAVCNGHHLAATFVQEGVANIPQMSPTVGETPNAIYGAEEHA